MNIKLFLAPLLSFALVLTMAFAALAPLSAQAACSPTGFINSAGKCVKSFPTNWNWSYNYQNRYFEYHNQTLLALIQHLQEMIRQLEAQLDDDDNTSDVFVTTRAATDIRDDSATLNGRVYLSSEDEAGVYFEYGRSRTSLTGETAHKTIEEDGDYTFKSNVDGLSEDTLYYFRAVAEDENGDESRGVILSFRTDEDQNDDNEPELNTYNATDIESDSAEVSGRVDMNDFNNGRVFFVYGEDRSLVSDIPDEYERYSEIDEDGDDLQKTLVDDDLDRSATYQETLTGLDPDSDIYFSICVEYENEDDDDEITCGDIESFETDD